MTEPVTPPRPTRALLHRPPWFEAIAATLIISGVVGAWINSLGGLALSWDSLNHHFYLGWMAVEGSRLTNDIFAAGSMSCQYPYAYAPLYALQLSGVSGNLTALVLAIPAFAAIPAIWLIAWTFLPTKGLGPVLQRFVWVILGFVSPLWWSLLDTTSNDLASTLPMVWAFAFVGWRGACQLADERHLSQRHGALSLGWYVLAGALAALALTIKVGHVFAALGLAVFLAASARSVISGVVQFMALCAGGVAVATLVWWPWARSVWIACGSPIYPMMTEWLRPLVGVIP